MAKKKSLKTASPPIQIPIVIQQKVTSEASLTLDMWRAAKSAALNIYQPSKYLLCELFDDILHDLHLWSVYDKRIMAVTNTNWTFTVDGKEHEQITDLTKKYFFEKLIKYIIQSKLHGYSVIEVDFRTQKCELVPRAHCIIESSLVLQDPYMNEGWDYTEAPFDRTTIAVGEDWDLGLLFKAASMIILKRGDVSDWATFAEIFGSPSRLYFYDPNIPGNYEQVCKTAESAGANSWVALPIGSDMKQESQGSKQGNDIYERLANFCNKEISVGILGQTMTTESGSSYSQSKVHADTEDDINASDRRFVERILNELIVPLLQKQGFDIPDGGRFHAADIEEELSSKDQLDMDLRIHKEVAPLPLEHFTEKYNVKFDLQAKKEKDKQKEQAQKQHQPNQPVKLSDVKRKINLADRVLSYFSDFFL